MAKTKGKVGTTHVALRPFFAHLFLNMFTFSLKEFCDPQGSGKKKQVQGTEMYMEMTMELKEGV